MLADLILCLLSSDETPPTIICPEPFQFNFTSENESRTVMFNSSIVTVRDDVTPSDQLNVSFAVLNYTFNSLSLLQSFPPTHYASVTATVEDAAGNKDSCNIGLFFQRMCFFTLIRLCLQLHMFIRVLYTCTL